jgi:hypothetical protein
VWGVLGLSSFCGGWGGGGFYGWWVFKRVSDGVFVIKVTVGCKLRVYVVSSYGVHYINAPI